MSELKVHRFITTDELFPEANAGVLYYEKSEADKVIVDLKAENESLKKTLQHSEDELESYFIFEKEIKQELRRHKYKRCLAMAKWCVNGEYKLKRVKMRDMNNHQFWQFDTGYWKKWHKRWLEIAEQFKPNNSLNRPVGQRKKQHE